MTLSPASRRGIRQIAGVREENTVQLPILGVAADRD